MPVVKIGEQTTEMVAAGLSMPAYKHLLPPLGVGDVLLLQVDSAPAAPIINTPTGWTAFFSGTTSGTTLKQGGFGKVVTASDITSVTTPVTVTFSASVTARVTVMAFRGAESADITFFNRSSTAGTSNAPTSAATSAQVPGCMIVHMVATTGVADVTPPATYTEMADTPAIPGSNTIRGQASYRTQAAEGVVSAAAASIASSAAWVASVVVIPPTDAPIFVSASTGSNTSATVDNVVITKPTGATAGDALVASVKVDSLTAVVYPPATFILVSDTPSGTFRQLVFKKTIPSPLPSGYTEPAGYQFRRGPAGYIAVVMTAMRSVFTTGEIFGAGASAATASGTTHSGSLTTTRANSRLVWLASQAGNNAATNIMSVPTGLTREMAQAQIMQAATALQAGAGPSGTKTTTSSVTAPGVVALYELLARYETPGPAWDPTAMWGPGEVYLPAAPAAWDAGLYWGHDVYMTAAAAQGVPQMMLLGVG